MMRAHRINKLLLALVAVALINAVIDRLYEHHLSAQLEHVHRHLVAGCQLVEGETEATCEARWLVALSK